MKKQKSKKSDAQIEFEKSDAWVSFTKLVAEIEADPNADGWIRLIEILTGAQKDKRILSSAGASSFLELVLDIASDAITTSSAEQAIQPLAEILKSIHARDAAAKSNKVLKEAKKWVQREWEQHKEAYKKNKSDFARTYARLVLNTYGEEVTDTTIRARWLKDM